MQDASSLSLSDASSFEIPQIGEIQPEKVDFPAVQQEGADTASKWAYEVEPNVLPSDFDVVVPELATKVFFLS